MIFQPNKFSIQISYSILNVKLKIPKQYRSIPISISNTYKKLYLSLTIMQKMQPVRYQNWAQTEHPASRQQSKLIMAGATEYYISHLLLILFIFLLPSLYTCNAPMNCHIKFPRIVKGLSKVWVKSVRGLVSRLRLDISGLINW